MHIQRQTIWAAFHYKFENYFISMYLLYLIILMHLFMFCRNVNQTSEACNSIHLSYVCKFLIFVLPVSKTDENQLQLSYTKQKILSYSKLLCFVHILWNIIVYFKIVYTIRNNKYKKKTHKIQIQKQRSLKTLFYEAPPGGMDANYI